MDPIGAIRAIGAIRHRSWSNWLRQPFLFFGNLLKSLSKRPSKSVKRIRCQSLLIGSVTKKLQYDSSCSLKVLGGKNQNWVDICSANGFVLMRRSAFELTRNVSFNVFSCYSEKKKLLVHPHLFFLPSTSPAYKQKASFLAAAMAA